MPIFLPTALAVTARVSSAHSSMQYGFFARDLIFH